MRRMRWLAKLGCCLAVLSRCAALRLVTTTTLPGVPPSRATDFLATPANWPKSERPAIRTLDPPPLQVDLEPRLQIG